jgi:hypothetical protein
MQLMMTPICRYCSEPIEDDDYRKELCRQADALGMESLTENQQLLVTQRLCEKRYDLL